MPSPHPASPRRPVHRGVPAPGVLALGVLVVSGLLGGCQADRAVTGSVYPVDVRARHPIVLADGTRSLDVFPTGRGHLDPRQAGDIEAFLLEYRRYGRGELRVEVPHGVGPGIAPAVEATAANIRRLSAGGGVPAGALVMAGYGVADPGLAAPIRLSFQRMDARVADDCGLWPKDLGVSTPASNFRNEPHWNLGCATQSNVAAQIADPIDLVRGRPAGRIDTVKRVQDIGKLREGKDPSTTWRQDGTTSVRSQLGL